MRRLRQIVQFHDFSVHLLIPGQSEYCHLGPIEMAALSNREIREKFEIMWQNLLEDRDIPPYDSVESCYVVLRAAESVRDRVLDGNFRKELLSGN